MNSILRFWCLKFFFFLIFCVESARCEKEIGENRNRDKDWNFIVHFAIREASVEENEGLRPGIAKKNSLRSQYFSSSQFLHEYISFRGIFVRFNK